MRSAGMPVIAVMNLLDMLGRDLHGVGFERPLPFVAAFAQFRTECDFAQACRGGLFVDQFFDRLAAFAPHLVECVFHLAEFGRFARRLQVYASPSSSTSIALSGKKRSVM